jgi:hypothetical protein
MSAIANAIDAVIRNGLAQELKAAGFRKTGRTWRSSAGDPLRVTNLQGSSWNSGDSGRFTINLGVYFAAAANLHGVFPVTDRPTEPDCLVRQRIGPLMPQGLDHWWEVGTTTDLELLGRQVAACWTTYGRPWLVAHSDPRVARAHLAMRGHHWWAAIFSVMLGEEQAARDFIDRAIADAPNNAGLQRRLSSWKGTVGL